MLSAVLVLIPVIVYGQVTCPDNTWTRQTDGSSCYKAIGGTTSIRQCANNCQAQSSSLACVNDATENTFIRTQFTGTNWIGLYQAPNSQNPPTLNFNRWADGCNSGFRSFASGQPNDDAGQESCTVSNNAGQWADVSCRSATAVCICEFPSTNTNQFFTDLSSLESGDTQNSSPTAADDDDSSISSGAITGIVLGSSCCCLLCIAALAALAFLALKKKKQPRVEYDYPAPPPQMAPPVPMAPNTTPVLTPVGPPVFMDAPIVVDAPVVVDGPMGMGAPAYGYY